ncbi:hypothetical protein [Serratia plymuthica]|nr:hypothetical protein [Serratia plymuthica]
MRPSLGAVDWDNCYAYYVEKEPVLARTSRYQIEQIAAEMGLTL